MKKHNVYKSNICTNKSQRTIGACKIPTTSSQCKTAGLGLEQWNNFIRSFSNPRKDKLFSWHVNIVALLLVLILLTVENKRSTVQLVIRTVMSAWSNQLMFGKMSLGQELRTWISEGQEWLFICCKNQFRAFNGESIMHTWWPQFPHLAKCLTLAGKMLQPPSFLMNPSGNDSVVPWAVCPE